MRVRIITTVGPLDVCLDEVSLSSSANLNLVGQFWRQNIDVYKNAQLTWIESGKWVRFTTTSPLNPLTLSQICNNSGPVGRGSLFVDASTGDLIITIGVVEEIADSFAPIGQVYGDTLYSCLVDNLSELPSKEDEKNRPLYSISIKECILLDDIPTPPAKSASIAKNNLAPKEKLKAKLEAQIKQVKDQLNIKDPDSPDIKTSPKVTSSKDKNQTEQRERNTMNRLSRFQQKLKSLHHLDNDDHLQIKPVIEECTLHGLINCQSCHNRNDNDSKPLIGEHEEGSNSSWLCHKLYDES